LRVEAVLRDDLEAWQLVVHGPECLADGLKDTLARTDGDHNLPRWVVGTHLLAGRGSHERDRERHDTDGPSDVTPRIAVVSYAP
jgi:hypothetical protein